MQEFWTSLDAGGGPFNASTSEVFLRLLLAFVLGQALAWVYYATHSGMSYSRNFVQSLVLITVVVAMVMAVISNSLVTAVGLIGALAIIRFRNILKDTRDIAFVFCVLAVGMACGAGRLGVAVVGTVMLGSIAWYLNRFGFGAHEPHNAFLRLRAASPVGDHPLVRQILDQYNRRWILAAANETSSQPSEYTFHLQIADMARNGAMIAALQAVDGVLDLYLTLQEQLLEI
jgi:uncharacterized membrane protein YhiD involved in acid resistance